MGSLIGVQSARWHPLIAWCSLGTDRLRLGDNTGKVLVYRSQNSHTQKRRKYEAEAFVSLFMFFHIIYVTLLVIHRHTVYENAGCLWFSPNPAIHGLTKKNHIQLAPFSQGLMTLTHLRVTIFTAYARYTPPPHHQGWNGRTQDGMSVKAWEREERSRACSHRPDSWFYTSNKDLCSRVRHPSVWSRRMHKHTWKQMQHIHVDII